MATESQPPVTDRKKPDFSSVLIPVALILVAVLFGLTYLRGKDKEHHASEGGAIQRKVGEAIPDLEFKSQDGKVTKLSEIKAKVILINFWATWCAPCVKELPSLSELSNEFVGDGLKVVGVNVDENPEEVLPAFLKKHQIKYDSFVDPKGEVADRFAVSGLPLTLVVDSERKLLLEQVGDEEWSSPEMKKQFALWLGKGK